MGNRKLPFGYKMVMGEIVVHPQEAQAVQGIYARYLAGASFNDITDHLKEKGPPYDADKPYTWLTCLPEPLRRYRTLSGNPFCGAATRGRPAPVRA
jgi:hypothetical protein